MAIYRGIGGAGDSTTDATVTAVTEKAVDAADSAASAATSETNASNSASAASTSATNASNSASNASTSETNASNSATAAALSESNASTSETNAASSASAASTSESNAAASESAASTSETNAATSETNAATSESNAASSASAASTSASNAATSESNASTSETNAATSATNAATSETNAQTAADTALSALDNFDDRYLGQKASDPTLDNDGDALVAGALYFNTTDDVMKVYEGSVWVAAYASLSGTLVAVNNLSDLSDVSAARTNLGLGTAATTASTDYATAAQGALADSALQNLVEDTTPQLGGDLASNGNDITFGDNDKAIFGVGSDLQIYHDAGNSLIVDNGTGDLYIRASDNFNLQVGNGAGGWQDAIRTYDANRVDISHAGSVKLATTATGVDVTGTVTADGLTVDTDTLHVDATNNRVGIGTASPSYNLDIEADNPTARILEPRTGGTVGTSSLKLHGNRTGTGGAVTSLEFINTDGAASVAETSVNSIQTFYESAGNQNFRFNAGGSEVMRIDSSGNVGIGTSSPATTLAVNDSNTNPVQISVFSSASAADGRLGVGSTGNAIAVFDDNTVLEGRDGGLALGTGGNDPILFYTTSGRNERMRIDSSGNVGIGTSSPTGQLHVSSNAGNTITLETFVDNGNDSTFKFHKARGGSSGPSQITAGDDLGTIEWFGYDGSSWNAAASIKVDSTANTGDFDAIMSFNTGSERMRIDSSGKVGIGTSSPSTALDVNGTVTATSYAGDGSALTGVASDVVDDTTPQLGGDLDLNSNDITGTGGISITGDIVSDASVVAGEGNGGIALTVNDGGGHSNICFNHKSQTPEQAGNAGRINVNTDSTTSCNMLFQLAENVSSGVLVSANNVMQLKADGELKFNSGYGSLATAYGVRAWVNFDGTGTVTIRASGNVSSITDFGVGYYRANFTTAMPDANYGFTVMAGDGGVNRISFDAPTFNLITTTDFRMRLYDSSDNQEDCDYVSFTAIR